MKLLFDDVSKTFDKQIYAVKNFTLEIQPGVLTVLMGPSGCGKTTVLRMAAGLEKCSRGKIYLGQNPVHDIQSQQRNIAMVFQQSTLYPHMTVKQNMAYALRIQKFPTVEIEKHVLSTARLLGIDELLQRKPAALSGGQQQRAALGKAIVRHPNLFLLDEPLSNLDGKTRHELRIEIKRLHQELKTTMLYVTHDQTEAMCLGDRIVVMDRGTIQQAGRPSEIYNFPQNQLVAQSIGYPPMNFFTGSLICEHHVLLVQVEAFRLRLPKEWLLKIQKWINQKITIGIRPQDMQAKPENSIAHNDYALYATVNWVENWGEVNYLHVKCLGQSFFALQESERPLASGDWVTLSVNYSKIHVFDPLSGQRIAK